MSMPGKSELLSCMAVLSLLLAGGTVSASDIKLKPSLSIQEVFSDNINQGPGSDESEIYTTVITPGISLNSDGNRIKTRLIYNLQSILYLF